MRASAAWPHILLDPLDALDGVAEYRRRPELFPPLRTPRKRQRETVEHEGDAIVENEPGLCERMEATHAALRKLVAARGGSCCADWRLAGSGDSQQPAATAPLPPLATLLAAQLYLRPLRVVDAPQALQPPLLFSALVRNRKRRAVTVEALGARWIVPPHSAFLFARLERWSMLADLRPRGGYRLILADPPWHSASAQRANTYATLDKRELLHMPVAQLAAADGCIVVVWITNSRHVQRFVERVLFPRWGARLLATWYWLKLSADGSLANGASPRSPHRKPWEPLLVGYIGTGVPPSLPARQVIGSVPLGHSHKPPLCALLRPLAAQLAPRPGSASPDDDAWRALPKLELFARELRPGWHSVGDEVLRFQHESFWEETNTRGSTGFS